MHGGRGGIYYLTSFAMTSFHGKLLQGDSKSKVIAIISGVVGNGSSGSISRVHFQVGKGGGGNYHLT